MAWCALMNSKTRAGSRRSRVRTRRQLERGCRAPTAAACSHAAAGPIPHAQPRKPVALFLLAALLPVGLRNPVADRLRGRFKLPGKLGRIPAGADQLDHPTAKLG